MPLTPGQDISVDLEAKLLETDYLWRWTTHIGSLPGSAVPEIYFEQSQLTGEVLSAAKLHKAALDYVPELSEEGRLRQRTFGLMDGTHSLEEIARRLAAEFPDRFPASRQALSFAGRYFFGWRYPSVGGFAKSCYSAGISNASCKY